MLGQNQYIFRYTRINEKKVFVTSLYAPNIELAHDFFAQKIRSKVAVLEVEEINIEFRRDGGIDESWYGERD